MKPAPTAAIVLQIVLAGGGDGRLAVAARLILAARAVTAIVTVLDQVGRLHGRTVDPRHIIAADLAAASLAALAVGVNQSMTAGAGAVLAVMVVQSVMALRPTPRAVVLV